MCASFLDEAKFRKNMLDISMKVFVIGISSMFLRKIIFDEKAKNIKMLKPLKTEFCHPRSH